MESLVIWPSSQDNDYRIIRKGDIEPDFDDPDWHQKISDWDDFWNYQRWWAAGPPQAYDM